MSHHMLSAIAAVNLVSKLGSRDTKLACIGINVLMSNHL